MLDIIEEGKLIKFTQILGLISEGHLQRQCMQGVSCVLVIHIYFMIQSSQGIAKFLNPNSPSAFDLVSSICHNQMEASRKRNLSDRVQSG